MDIMTQLRQGNQPGVIPEPIPALGPQLMAGVQAPTPPQTSNILSQLQSPGVNNPAAVQLTQLAETLQTAVNSLLTIASQIR
jgi:hypothetical protein